ELLLQILLALGDDVTLENRALFVEVLFHLLELGLFVVELLLLGFEEALELLLGRLAFAGLVDRALHVDVPDLQILSERAPTEKSGRCESQKETNVFHGLGVYYGLEEVANREFEYDRVLARLRRERQTPLESERSDGREPAEAEAPAGAEIERVESITW